MTAAPPSPPGDDAEDDTSAGTELDVEAPDDSQRFLRPLLLASDRTGRSPISMIVEWVGYRFGRSKLEADEYFRFGLYDSERFTSARKAEFLSTVRRHKLNNAANEASRVSAIIDNKLYVEAMLRGFGVPCTRTLAVFAAPGRFGALRSIQVLSEEPAVRDFLADQAGPVFAKPLGSSLSLGTVSIDRLADDGDQLELSNGTTMSLAGLCAQVRESFYDTGYVFQEKLQVHPDLVRYPGSAVGTFRVVTSATPEGIRPLYAAWKIPSATSMADNLWRDDNLIAQVDVQSGEIVRCQKDVGIDATEIETLPESDVAVVGEVVPEWSDVVDLAVGVAHLFPDNRIMGFDIALTPSGPVLVEANSNPDHGLYQIASGQGFLRPEWAELMAWNAKQAKATIKERKTGKKQRNRQRLGQQLNLILSDLKADLDDRRP